MTRKILFFTGALLIGSLCNAQTINTGKLNALLQKAEETHSEAVIIYKDNKLVAEKYFGIGKPGTKIEAMSCTKSIVGLAVACMLEDKLIDSLDVPVATFYKEWRQGKKQRITIRHLVNMTSGMQNVPNTEVEIYPSYDFVQLALCAELDNAPGEKWSYNNKSLNLMAGVIKQATGKRMDQYIGERLFKPLGITDFTWSLDSAGNPHVMSGCQIKPADFIKLGLLVANGGGYNNQQVLSKENIDKVVSPCPQFKGYGMLWWLEYEQVVSIIDDSQIDAMKKAGVAPDFIAKAEEIKGRYTSDDAYTQKVEKVLGKNAADLINTNLRVIGLTLRRREFEGKIVSYRADGYLGNYIIVCPGSNIVAVRMISHASFKGPADNFSDFKDRVLQLVD